MSGIAVSAAGPCPGWIVEDRQIEAADVLVGYTKGIRGDTPHLPDHFRGVTRGQKADLAVEDASREGNGKSVVVNAEIEGMTPRGQQVSDPTNLA